MSKHYDPGIKADVNYPALKGGACGKVLQARVDQTKTSTKER